MTTSGENCSVTTSKRMLVGRWARVPAGVLILLPACLCLEAASLSIDHEATLQYDLGNVRVPGWSNGALATFTSNQTPAPVVLQFDAEGRQLQPIIVSVPEAETVDLNGIARGSDGTLVACGTAYDHTGHGSGFLAVFNPAGDKSNVIRLYPYRPFRVAVDSDGTIWTTGFEDSNPRAALDSTPPTSGVVRHFDPTGKLIGAFIPRAKFTTRMTLEYGWLQCARGRVGLYIGPPWGPGSRYFEILPDGTVREYPAIAVAEHEWVDGLALTNDGRTYVMIRDQQQKPRLLTTRGPQDNWSLVEPIPSQTLVLYGADGDRLVFMRHDRFTVSFVNVPGTKPI